MPLWPLKLSASILSTFWTLQDQPHLTKIYMYEDILTDNEDIINEVSLQRVAVPSKRPNRTRFGICITKKMSIDSRE